MRAGAGAGASALVSSAPGVGQRTKPERLNVGDPVVRLLEPSPGQGATGSQTPRANDFRKQGSEARFGTAPL